MSIEDNPKVVAGTSEFSTVELEALKSWIIKNRIALLEFWNSDTMDYEDIKPRLKRLA